MKKERQNNQEDESKHQENVMKLMEMFAMDMPQAESYLKSMNFDIDNAIHFKLDPHSLPYQQLNQHQFTPILQHYINVDQKESLHVRPQKSQRHISERVYKKTYLIKKKQKAPKKISQYKKRGKRTAKTEINQPSLKIQEEELQFSQQFSTLIGQEVCVNFHNDPYDVFEQLWKNRKLVAVHCISFSSQNGADNEVIYNFIKQVYKQGLTCQMFNKNFINMGIDPSKFDFNHYTFMRQFINPTDNSLIVLLRYDQISGKVTNFHKLKICQQNFKLSDQSFFQSKCKGLIKQYNGLNYRAFQGIKPQTEEQKRRIEQDRLIMKQQEEDYYEHILKSTEVKPQEQLEKQQIADKEATQLKRQRMRELLPIYLTGLEKTIDIKIRLPNGSAVHLCLPQDETVEYIFKYIESYQGDIGFEDDLRRSFDIIQPLQRLSLSQHKQQSLEKMFQGSTMETVAIKQL